MLKTFLGVLFAGLVVGLLHAESATDYQRLEEEIERATAALERAARRLSELEIHIGNHPDHSEVKNKAMLGVLLGPEPSIGGVPIVGTTPKGGAAQAGMLAGDLIVEIGGVNLRDKPDPLGTLSAHMSEVVAGDTVELVFFRDGEDQRVQITTQPNSKHIISLLDDDLNSIIEQSLDDLEIDIEIPAGLETFTQRIKLVKGPSNQIMSVEGDLAEYFDVEKGVIVTDVQASSQLKNGDVFLALGDVNVADLHAVSDFLVTMEDEVAARIQRQGRRLDVVISPGEFTAGVDRAVNLVRNRDKGKP